MMHFYSFHRVSLCNYYANVGDDSTLKSAFAPVMLFASPTHSALLPPCFCMFTLSWCAASFGRRFQAEEAADRQRADRRAWELPPPGGGGGLRRAQLLWLAAGGTGPVHAKRGEAMWTRDSAGPGPLCQQQWWVKKEGNTALCHQRNQWFVFSPGVSSRLDSLGVIDT